MAPHAAFWTTPLLLLLLACEPSPGSSSNESSPSAKAAAAAASPEAAGGVYCSVESATSCYDLDLEASTITLMMGSQRGKTYPLEKKAGHHYTFSLTGDHSVTIRVRSANTIEAETTGSSSSTKLVRKR